MNAQEPQLFAETEDEEHFLEALNEFDLNDQQMKLVFERYKFE